MRTVFDQSIFRTFRNRPDSSRPVSPSVRLSSIPVNQSNCTVIRLRVLDRRIPRSGSYSEGQGG